MNPLFNIYHVLSYQSLLMDININININISVGAPHCMDSMVDISILFLWFINQPSHHIEKGAPNPLPLIVDIPIRNGGSFRYVKLPRGYIHMNPII